MIKKILAITFAIVMVALCFAGCGAQSDQKTLIVGFDAEFPPYGFVDSNGNYDGFDLACAKEVCKRLGWKYDEVAIDWDAKDNELAAGNITCIWNGFTYTGREEEYTWSDPYVDNTIVAVTKTANGYKTLADLAGKTVMVQKASSAADAVNSEDNAELKASFKEVIELADYNTGFMELEQGTVDAVIVDIGVAKFQIGDQTDKYTIIEEAVSTEQYAVGFLLGDYETRDAVNAVLHEMAEDGTMMNIAKKYEKEGINLQSLILCNQ